jgi:hypothetical protein
MLDAWNAPEAEHGHRAGPFHAVNLTGADVGWLAEQVRSSNDGFVPDLYLERAALTAAHLEQATLSDAHLEGAILVGAHMEGADLRPAHLKGADLRLATFDKNSHLNGAVLAGASLDQAIYDGVNLTVVDWSLAPLPGDEVTANWRKDKDMDMNDKLKDRAQRLQEFTAAVRANRVLAVTLRSQGMNEDADRYAYRAQLLQRKALRLRRRWGAAFGSWVLDLISVYGYQPIRSVIAYLLIIALFSGAYFGLGVLYAHPLSWNEAIVVSLTAFHGRGFFSIAFSPGDPQAALAAIEAVIGLLIEITFIATFTQRFFSR